MVLGRSDIVGSPVVAMLRNRDATVTHCHSRTRNIESIVSTSIQQGIRDIFELMLRTQVRNADIVVSAIGKAELVRGSWIKPGAVVIDVGINYVPGMDFLEPNLV